jgi:hypothetical protein
MINIEIIFSVLIGGVLTLLGTLLANFLQFRTEQRRVKIEITKERLSEVRRYISACLEYVDLMSIPTTLGPKGFEKDAFKEWMENVDANYQAWKNLPASGSARVLLVDDREILADLAEIDKFRVKFYANYLNMIDRGTMLQLDDSREELKELATKVGKRLDKMLDEIK